MIPSLALAAFKRTLITPDRFDDFMQGNAGALTDKKWEMFLAKQY